MRSPRASWEKKYPPRQSFCLAAPWLGSFASRAPVIATRAPPPRASAFSRPIAPATLLTITTVSQRRDSVAHQPAAPMRSNRRPARLCFFFFFFFFFFFVADTGRAAGHARRAVLDEITGMPDSASSCGHWRGRKIGAGSSNASGAGFPAGGFTPRACADASSASPSGLFMGPAAADAEPRNRQPRPQPSRKWRPCASELVHEALRRRPPAARASSAVTIAASGGEAGAPPRPLRSGQARGGSSFEPRCRHYAMTSTSP